MAKTIEVYTNATRGELIAFLRSLPGIISGRLPDRHGIGKGFRARVAFAFYALVAEAFDKKSHHQTDSAGEKWKDNSPEYLAYHKHRRKHWKEIHSYSQLRTDHLTAEQLATWRAVNREALKEFSLKYEYKKAKAMAAVRAWKATREMGAQNLIDYYPANMEDTILVDTGSLRQSILPGELIGGQGSETYKSYNSNQLFEDTGGRIVVGSKHYLAAAHHKAERIERGQKILKDGKQKRGGTIRRRFWPEELPAEWLRQIMGQAMAGLDIIARVVQEGSL